MTYRVEVLIGGRFVSVALHRAFRMAAKDADGWRSIGCTARVRQVGAFSMAKHLNAVAESIAQKVGR